jgi:hypothetical protein
MSKFERGPCNLYRVEYKSEQGGFTYTRELTAHQVLWSDGQVMFHAEINGKWTLLWTYNATDIVSIRNVDRDWEVAPGKFRFEAGKTYIGTYSDTEYLVERIENDKALLTWKEASKPKAQWADVEQSHRDYVEKKPKPATTRLEAGKTYKGKRTATIYRVACVDADDALVWWSTKYGNRSAMWVRVEQPLSKYEEV